MSEGQQPVVAVLGGVNGAGKTTASQHVLRDVLKIPTFVKSDARVYDNSHGRSRLIAFGIGEKQHVLDGDRWDDFERSATRG